MYEPTRLSIQRLFSKIPDNLREVLVRSLNKVEKNFRENRWEPSELNGAKMCEAVVAILEHEIGFKSGKKPDPMPKRCNRIESCSKEQLTDDLRLVVPRIVLALYSIRNHRGVGHAFGNVSPNKMDAQAVISMSRWLVAELIRHFHGVSPQQAQDAVDALIVRDIQFVWHVDDVTRILIPHLNQRDATLLLLYSYAEPLHECIVAKCIEPKKLSIFRRDVLQHFHAKRYIEFSKSTKFATLSPAGIDYVERKIIPKLEAKYTTNLNAA